MQKKGRKHRIRNTSQIGNKKIFSQPMKTMKDVIKKMQQKASKRGRKCIEKGLY